MDCGIVGISVACILTNSLVLITLHIYTLNITEIAQISTEETQVKYWSFDGLKDYMKLGLPITMMVCFEWWAYQVMVFMSGYLGVNE